MAVEPTEQARILKGSSATRARLVTLVVGLVLVYAFLLIPERRFETPAGAGKRPFVWDQDGMWKQLEAEFIQAKQSKPLDLSNRVESLLAQARKTLDELKATPASPGQSVFVTLEDQVFRLAPLVAAGRTHTVEYARLVQDARTVTKQQSREWDLRDPASRAQLYRILFGGRMALEAVLVQAPPDTALPVACGGDEPPARVPTVQYEGITFQSGDLFVSRGSKPTSSLIARGNDYPGSFSHVALLHVERDGGKATIIESLIERGVITMPFEAFMKEQRLRLMALRLRPDLPALRLDPELPHRAAGAALTSALRGHIPYDFSMNFRDHEAMFCSEVASSAYESAGVSLWMGMTWISSPVLTAWLGSVGVRHFETQEPADLEYDPQLRVFAEWRQPLNLFQAHLDDATTDTMIAEAVPASPLPYDHLKLPLARVAKVYSIALNSLGKLGPVPEGMSATTALRVDRFCREHQWRKQRLAQAAENFRAQAGYLPPYWELLKLGGTPPKAKHLR